MYKTHRIVKMAGFGEYSRKNSFKCVKVVNDDKKLGENQMCVRSALCAAGLMLHSKQHGTRIFPTSYLGKTSGTSRTSNL